MTFRGPTEGAGRGDRRAGGAGRDRRARGRAAASDSDGDGLPNAFERQKSHTNPHRKDTDRDGVLDTYEDPDHDGLWNRYEYLAGTNPRKKDTDGDGTNDGAEDPDHDGLSNAREQAAPDLPAQGRHRRRRDAGRPRGSRRRRPVEHHEFRADTAPRDADSDNDGFRDGIEGTRDEGCRTGWSSGAGTNPGLKDTDGDGKADGREDPDADGLMTLAEVVRGLDPTDADSDDDGTLDGDESVDVATRRSSRAPPIARCSRPTTSGTSASTASTSRPTARR